MSAFEDDPEHFLRWMWQRDGACSGGSFVPRPLYGQYLRHVLAEAEASAAPGAELERIPGEVIAIRPRPAGSGQQVVLAGGRTILADTAVLAIGNYPPADPAAEGEFASDPRYARDPWAHDALHLQRGDAVLLVGTGLTMLDIALALRDQGHRGVIHAVSRRGLLPQPHRSSPTPPPHHDRPASIARWEPTALGLFRALRREVAEASSRGIDWREVVTSIRADTPALWGALPLAERRRFLTHLRPFWETHRHRAAPQTWAGVESMMRTGQLRVGAGRLIRVEGTPQGLRVTLRPRGSDTQEQLSVARIINCTGPDTDFSRIREPLVASLRDEGLIRPDALGLGLETDDRGALLDRAGSVNTGLYLVGPLRKGRMWENTAVPELRIEARRLAERLAPPAAGRRSGAAQGVAARF